MKIGNKHYSIKCNCENCGKEFFCSPTRYLSSKYKYCSKECYAFDKTNKIEHGKDSKYYNRIKCKCDNCGKELEIIKSHYNIKNSYGDNHNFCSRKCYSEFRKIYYVGDKSASNFFEYTEEMRNKNRENFIKRLSRSDRLNTKIQKSVNKMLDELNIKYEREYPMTYYSIDNYLYDYGLMIEVMGDYWHTNPNRYNENKYKINDIQKKGILKDKQKHSYIKNKRKIEVLYLWESDINNEYDKCKKLIEKYVMNKGNIENYHSFNWTLNYNNLILKESIIIPYQNLKSEYYGKLIYV